MDKIWISTGTSREETNWKNIELTWERFLERMGKPTRTSETIAHYLEMDKDRQLNIKDVGGYVGGTIRGGRRLINSCSARYLITLDIDYASQDFIEEVEMLYGNAMNITTTHKHTPASPRYRLILPMSREVLADEYEAIARKIAGNIGIELFDPTTFQPERLMFWPSVASDGEFINWTQSGPWIDPDKVLAEYKDWRDSAEWPVSAKAAKKFRDKVGKQEDPTMKGGMIGVFCRSYNITDAIAKFLPEIYVPTTHKDRYTYAKGSTHAGVIVYDDLFTYSHHSTDPTMGRLCNAFDLVRIQLYGELDDNAAEKTPANKLPSFVKMCDMISKDPRVRKIGLTEQLEQVKGDFAMPEGMTEEDKEWLSLLETDKKGNVFATIANLVTILNNDPNLKDNLCFDDFEKRPMLKRDLPWRKVDRLNKSLKDTDDAGYRNYMEKVYKIVSTTKIKDAMDIVMMGNLFHPVKEYLQGLKWDGTKRLERLFIDKLGADDDEYTRTITRKTFVAGVARIFAPGCKFDTVLTLIGPQGIGKSRLVASMGGKWFSDTFGRLDNNQAMENLQGVWIMEIGELAGLKRHEVEAIKLFIAKAEDRYRVAYGRRVEPFARQSIFIGTSNDDTPLRDHSGGRRFWIMRVNKKMEGNLSRTEIDQLWAEAVTYYNDGEDLFLDPAIEATAQGIQMQHTEMDERIHGIRNYINMEVPFNWYDLSTYDRRSYVGGDETIGKPEMLRDKICIPEIWTELLGGTVKDMSTFNTKFIRGIMNSMPGWEKRMINTKGWGDQRGWVREGIFELKK